MDDAHAQTRSVDHDPDNSERDGRSSWERALEGPPINPRSDLIYHDGKPLRSRHRSER